MQPPIVFSTQGNPGVNLQNALTGNLSTLDRRNEQVVVSNTSNRITLRILVGHLPDYFFQHADHLSVARSCSLVIPKYVSP